MQNSSRWAFLGQNLYVLLFWIPPLGFIVEWSLVSDFLFRFLPCWGLSWRSFDRFICSTPWLERAVSAVGFQIDASQEFWRGRNNGQILLETSKVPGKFPIFFSKFQVTRTPIGSCSCHLLHFQLIIIKSSEEGRVPDQISPENMFGLVLLIVQAVF